MLGDLNVKHVEYKYSTNNLCEIDLVKLLNSTHFIILNDGHKPLCLYNYETS